jgi:DNA-binding transcriptional MerR regulator
VNKDRREQLMSTGDVAKFLNCSTDNVRRLTIFGTLRAEYTTSGQRVFRMGDVEDFALARARKRGLDLEPPTAA